MMLKIITIIIAPIIVLTSLGRVVADSPADLLIKIDRNLAPESYEAYRKIINIEPDGKRKEFVLYMVRKGNDKMAAVFLDPPSDRDRSILRFGDNMWLYIPNIGKPVRITSLQSTTGGVFNNSDIMRVDFSSEYNIEQLQDTADSYLFHLKANSKSVAYSRLRLWAAKKELLPSKIQCLTDKDMLIKTLHFKEMKDFGEGIVRPSIIETESPLYKGYKSIMIFSNVKNRTVPDEIFSINYMSRLKDFLK